MTRTLLLFCGAGVDMRSTSLSECQWKVSDLAKSRDQCANISATVNPFFSSAQGGFGLLKRTETLHAPHGALRPFRSCHWGQPLHLCYINHPAWHMCAAETCSANAAFLCNDRGDCAECVGYLTLYKVSCFLSSPCPLPLYCRLLAALPLASPSSSACRCSVGCLAAACSPLRCAPAVQGLSDASWLAKSPADVKRFCMMAMAAPNANALAASLRLDISE